MCDAIFLHAIMHSRWIHETWSKKAQNSMCDRDSNSSESAEQKMAWLVGCFSCKQAFVVNDTKLPLLPSTIQIFKNLHHTPLFVLNRLKGSLCISHTIFFTTVQTYSMWCHADNQFQKSLWVRLSIELSLKQKSTWVLLQHLAMWSHWMVRWP